MLRRLSILCDAIMTFLHMSEALQRVKAAVYFVTSSNWCRLHRSVLNFHDVRINLNKYLKL